MATKNFTYKILDMEKAKAEKSAYTAAFLKVIIENGGTAARADIEAYVKGWLEAEKSETKITTSGVMSYQGHGLRKKGLIEILDEEGNVVEIKPRAKKEAVEGEETPETAEETEEDEEELEELED